MDTAHPKLRRLDAVTLELIIVVILITLHDFLLSDALSIPLVLKRSSLSQLRVLDKVASGMEFVVPLFFFIAMFILWLAGRNAWVRLTAIVFLAWVTLRLIAKIGLVVEIIISRPQTGVGVLLKDIIVMWLANFLLFGIWYWIIDGGGPDTRRDGKVKRFDFGFPQRMGNYPGWEGWLPGIWDYIYLGFSSSTQFGLGDTTALSVRVKLLLMLQVTLSIVIIVFIASIAITVIH
jgi:hypothetical protein